MKAAPQSRPQPRTRRRVAQWLASVFVLLGAAGGTAAQPATYRLIPERSFVHFEVLHFGTSTIRGRLGPLQGAVRLDPEAGSGEVGLTIPTATVSTGLSVFDARLREDDLLASASYPLAYFVARQFRFEGRRLVEVRGEFTWHGLSQAVSLKARVFGCRIDADATEVCGGDFEAEILRSEFGITYLLPFIGDRVRLHIQVEGRRG